MGSKGSGSATCSCTGQIVHRGVVRDVGRAVQEQQPARLLVGERQVLGDGAAEGEPGVDEALVGVRGRGQDRALQQLVPADLVLMGHALLDGLEGAPVEEIRRLHLVPGRAQPVGRLVHRGPQPVRRMEKHDMAMCHCPPYVPGSFPGRRDHAPAWQVRPQFMTIPGSVEHGERAAPADRRRRLARAHAAGRLDRGPAAAAGRRTGTPGPRCGACCAAAACRFQVVLCTALLRASYDAGRDRRDHSSGDRPDPDAGPHRLHGLAGGAHRDGGRRLLVRPLRQRPPRSGPGPPGPHPGDADPAGGRGDRRSWSRWPRCC